MQSAGEPADFDRNCTWLSDGDKVILKVQTEYKDGRLDRAQLLDVLRKSNAKTYDRVDRVAGAGPGVLQLYLTFESSNTTDLVATQFVTPERNLVTITYLTDRRVQAAEGLALATLAVAKVDAIV